MITNKQYKEDMYYVLALFKAAIYTQAVSLDHIQEKYNELKGRIDAIPDEEVYVAAPFGNGVIPVQGFDPNEHEPHDLGNVLHIPSEDDK